MKVYIAGKIAGDLNYHKKFEKAQRDMERIYGVVLNPAVLPDCMTPADYMRICFSMIDTADAVAFLPDWRDSEGAKLEWQYCRYIGKKILFPWGLPYDNGNIMANAASKTAPNTARKALGLPPFPEEGAHDPSTSLDPILKDIRDGKGLPLI